MAAPGAVMVSSTADSGLRTSFDAPGSDTADRLSDVDADVGVGVDVVVKRVGKVLEITFTFDWVTANALVVGEEVKASEMMLLLLFERVRHTATKAKLEMRNMVMVVLLNFMLGNDRFC